MYSARLPNLLFDSKTSDVQLCIETSAGDPETVVPAHRLVLQCASEVFRAMLDTSNFKEGRTGIVELKVKGDMNDAITFLRYLYTKELEYVDLNVYVSILQTAHLYEVKNLVKICEDRIGPQLTPLNVCRTYSYLRIVASEYLLKQLKDFMLEFAFLIFTKDLHLTLDEECMIFVLSSDELNVLNEEQVLGAIWRWGCARGVIKDHLSKDIEEQIAKLLPLVRKHLLEDVTEDFPWFDVYKDQSTLTEIKILNLSPGNPIATIPRKNNFKTSLSRFAEVASLSAKATNVKFQSLDKDSLVTFSVNLNILLVGFVIHVESLEFITSCTFEIILNDRNISGITGHKIVLVNECTSQRQAYRSYDMQKHAYRPYNRQRPVYRSYDISGYWPDLDNQQYTEVVIQNINIYKIKFDFRTPVPLEKEKLNILKLKPTSEALPEISFKFYELPEYGALKFNGGLQFRPMCTSSAISKLYYFL